jgi:chromosome segregation ATPase
VAEARAEAASAEAATARAEAEATRAEVTVARADEVSAEEAKQAAEARAEAAKEAAEAAASITGGLRAEVKWQASELDTANVTASESRAQIHGLSNQLERLCMAKSNLERGKREAEAEACDARHTQRQTVLELKQHCEDAVAELQRQLSAERNAADAKETSLRAELKAAQAAGAALEEELEAAIAQAAEAERENTGGASEQARSRAAVSARTVSTQNARFASGAIGRAHHRGEVEEQSRCIEPRCARPRAGQQTAPLSCIR